jgi:hypothetical protein
MINPNLNDENDGISKPGEIEPEWDKKYKIKLLNLMI